MTDVHYLKCVFLAYREVVWHKCSSKSVVVVMIVEILVDVAPQPLGSQEAHHGQGHYHTSSERRHGILLHCCNQANQPYGDDLQRHFHNLQTFLGCTAATAVDHMRPVPVANIEDEDSPS